MNKNEKKEHKEKKEKKEKEKEAQKKPNDLQKSKTKTKWHQNDAKMVPETTPNHRNELGGFPLEARGMRRSNKNMPQRPTRCLTGC